VLQAQGLANKAVEIIHKSLYNRNSWVKHGNETKLLADKHLQEKVLQGPVYINTCRDFRKSSAHMQLEKFVRSRYWLQEKGPLAKITDRFSLQVISEANIEKPINAVFSDSKSENNILLLGCSTSQSALSVGNRFTCHTYWKRLSPISQNLWMFFQITDSEHRLLVHQINPLGGGRFGTSRWPIDKIIVDETELLLTEDTFQTGQYQVRIGVFDPTRKTLRRLSILNFSSLADQDNWARKFNNVVLMNLNLQAAFHKIKDSPTVSQQYSYIGCNTIETSSTSASKEPVYSHTIGSDEDFQLSLE